MVQSFLITNFIQVYIYMHADILIVLFVTIYLIVVLRYGSIRKRKTMSDGFEPV